MGNIYIISSPFQLLCAIEARSVYGSGSESTLIVLQLGELHSSGEQQICRLIDTKWTSVKVIPFQKSQGILRHIRKLQVISHSALQAGRSNFAFIGNGRMRWLKIASKILARQTIELDDGASSIYRLQILREELALSRSASRKSLEFFSIFARSTDAPFAQKNHLNSI